MQSLLSTDLSALPWTPLDATSTIGCKAGLYFAIDPQGVVHYVGRSLDVEKRWGRHHKFKALSKIDGVKIAWLYIDGSVDLHSIESEFIRSLKPSLNGLGNPERVSKTRQRKEVELKEAHTEEWYAHNHVEFLLNYHFVFIPKRRRKVLTANIAKRCREIFQALATEKGWDILALEVAPDHIHLVIGVKPTDTPHLVIKAFKGRSSRFLRAEFPELLRLPSLWTSSYFVSTPGNVSSESIRKYIEDPRHSTN